MQKKKHICSNGAVLFLCSNLCTGSGLSPWELSDALIWRSASYKSTQPFITGRQNPTTDSRNRFPIMMAYLAQYIMLFTLICWQNKESEYSLLSTPITEPWPRPFSGTLNCRRGLQFGSFEPRRKVDRGRK